MEMRSKIQWMLVARAGTSRTAVEQALIREAASDPRVDLAIALPGDVLSQSSQGASGAGLQTYDAVLEISAPVADSVSSLIGRFAGLGDRLMSVIDANLSFVLAGTEYVVMPGAAPVMLFCALRRLPSLTRPEFQHYWLNVHAEFGRRPGNRYRQFHTDDQASALAAGISGMKPGPFDGSAMAYFNDVEHLRSVLASPDIAREAFADEQRFINHAASLFQPFLAEPRTASH